MPNTPFDRAPARSSFAFQPSSPAQANAASSGIFNGARVLGGDSKGGVERATPMTFARPEDDGIPEFLRQAMEPYVQKKLHEQAVKGATDYAAGKSLKDIAKDDSGIASIFGPSSYHQGAAAFAATAAWAEKKQEIQDNPDLASMNTADTGKYLAEQYHSVMTGDPVADHMLQVSIMNDQGPMVAAITAKQAAHVQAQARQNVGNTYVGNSAALETTAGGLDLTSPSGQAALQQAQDTFVAGLVTKPHGMTDEAHQETVADALNTALHAGNVQGYQAFIAKGGGAILTPDQQTRLETVYNTSSNKKLADALWDDRIAGPLASLDMMKRMGGYTDAKSGKWVTLRPQEIVTKADEINTIAARVTGVTGTKLLTGNDVQSMLKEYNEGVFSAGLRVQSHQWELDKEQRDHAYQEQREQEKEAIGLKQTSTYAATGQLDAALSMGLVQEKDANVVMGSAYARGDYAALNRNFVNSGRGNSFVASQLQAGFANSIGTGPTKGFMQSIQAYEAMDKLNPAFASWHAGSFAARAERYEGQIKAGATPQEAYQVAFVTPPAAPSGSLPPGVKAKDARATVMSTIRAAEPRWFGLAGGSRVPLAESSANALAAWIMPRAAKRASESGLPFDQAASRVMSDGMASGEIERAGPFSWTNARAMTPLGDYVPPPADAMDKLITKVAGDKLTHAGYTAGAGGSSYETWRTVDGQGKPALIIHASGQDGAQPITVTVALDDLTRANRVEAGHALQDGSDRESKRRDAFNVSMGASADRNARGIAASNAQFKTNPDKDPAAIAGKAIGRLFQ